MVVCGYICKEKGIVCELATDLGYCKTTGCIRNQGYTTRIATINATNANKSVLVMSPVVHCKYCKYRFKNNGYDKPGCPIIDRRIWMDDENGFCSMGDID